MTPEGSLSWYRRW